MTKLERIEGKVDLLLGNQANLDARVTVLEKQDTRKHDKHSLLISSVVSIVIALITAFTGCISAGCQPPSEVPASHQVRVERQAVIRIDETSWEGTGHGTGEFIGPSLVLTAGHVCNDDALTVGVADDGTVFPLIQVLDHDGEPDDVCVMQSLGYESDVWLKLAKDDVSFGDQVYSMGWDYGEVFLLAYGTVGEPYQGWTAVNINTVPGDSGSALFNERGEVVGVLSRGVEFITLFVPLDMVKADLAEVEIQ